MEIVIENNYKVNHSDAGISGYGPINIYMKIASWQ